VIVKEAPIRRARRSSFVQLTQYITEGFEKTGIRTDFASWEDLTQYIVAPAAIDWSGARTDKTIAVEVGGLLSLETAACEMHAVAARNSKATNPVLHLILSWPERERPDTESIFEAARRVQRALGLFGHQYVAAIHDNTGNLHVHLEVNRVHPVTFKAARIPWMHKTLHRVAREIEIDFGWSHDSGLYEAVEFNGVKTIVHAGDRERLDSVRAGATRTESWSGEASFERWCRDLPAAALRAALADSKTATWQHVHEALAPFGVELRESSGGGMCVHDIGTRRPEESGRHQIVSLSRAFDFVKRSGLEERLGRFVPAQGGCVRAEIVTSYKRDPNKRIERRIERKAEQDALRERFRREHQDARRTRSIAESVVRDEFQALDRHRLADQDASYRASRAEIREDKRLTPLQKRQAYMLAKLSHAKVRKQLREQIQQERAQRRDLLPRLPSWRAWVEALAQTGDEVAISALRGLIYRERRGRRDRSDSETRDELNECALKPVLPVSTDPWVRGLTRLSWKVSSHGLVTYSLDGGGVAFVDAGPKLRFDHAEVSDEALQLALRYAEQKWGGELRLKGGDQVFRERVARAAVSMGVNVSIIEMPAAPQRKARSSMTR